MGAFFIMLDNSPVNKSGVSNWDIPPSLQSMTRNGGTCGAISDLDNLVYNGDIPDLICLLINESVNTNSIMYYSTIPFIYLYCIKRS